MRESMGSTWTLQLVLAFILLFVSFIAVTISYSKAFRIKNEIISIIEKYGGYNSQSAGLINDYLKAAGYSNQGRCRYGSSGNEFIGVSDLDNNHPSGYNDGDRYFYCVKKEKASNNIAISDITYEVTMFYKFKLPLVGNFADFIVKGKTTDMLDPENPNNSRNNPDLFGSIFS